MADVLSGVAVASVVGAVAFAAWTAWTAWGRSREAEGVSRLIHRRFAIGQAIYAVGVGVGYLIVGPVGMLAVVVAYVVFTCGVAVGRRQAGRDEQAMAAFVGQKVEDHLNHVAAQREGARWQ